MYVYACMYVCILQGTCTLLWTHGNPYEHVYSPKTAEKTDRKTDRKKQ